MRNILVLRKIFHRTNMKAYSSIEHKGQRKDTDTRTIGRMDLDIGGGFGDMVITDHLGPPGDV